MILVVDAGNTNIVFGLFEGDNLVNQFRMATEKIYTSDQYGIFILNAMNIANISSDIEGAAIASVVVKAVNPLRDAIKKYFHVEPLIVDATLDVGMENMYDNPTELGPDRFANAVGGYELYKRALIVVDFGTATTFSAVSSSGKFLGGAICTGINTSLDALSVRTSRLPGVEIAEPKLAIGTNTISNIISGVLLGHVGQVEYIIKKFKEQMKEHDVYVVATGGLSGIISRNTDQINDTRNYLTLEGINIIYNKINKAR